MRCLRPLLCVGFLLSSVAIGTGSQSLDAVDRGWYNQDGFHDTENPNYIVGDSRRFFCGECDISEARNFLVFDLSEITEPITSAVLSLALYNPLGFYSGDPFETYEVHEVTTPADFVTLAINGDETFADLADGTLYASRDVTFDDIGTEVLLTLNQAAIDAMNAATDPLFVFGGSISTLNDFPDNETIFGFTAEGENPTRLIINGSANAVDADFNNDSVIDCADVDALVAQIVAGDNLAAFDLDGNGSVDQADLTQWLADAGAANLPSQNPYLPGDANLDGSVDVSDFNIWNSNKLNNVAAWCSGDFTADGSIDVSDFNVWNSNKLMSSGRPGVVPEPQLGWWLMLGTALCLLRRSRAGRQD